MEKDAMNGKALCSDKRERKVQRRKLLGRSVTILGAVLLTGAIASPLCAQTYPNKPIRLVIPYSPGGGTDVLGRLIAQTLGERLGQAMVPENRGGAGANLGSALVAKSKPDGYTILLAATALAIAPSLEKNLNYDPIKDLAPISLIAEGPSRLLQVRLSLPVHSLKELVAYAKANPGKLTFGSTGVGGGPHLVTEVFKSVTKTNIRHVPYKGGGEAVRGLMRGDIDIYVGTPQSSLANIQSGKVRALAILRDSNERLPMLPKLPTSKEAGIDNLETSSWFGILAPAGTPPAIVNRLSAEWVGIAKKPATKGQFQKAEYVPISSTPEKFSGLLKENVAYWAKIIKEANIKID